MNFYLEQRLLKKITLAQYATWLEINLKSNTFVIQLHFQYSPPSELIDQIGKNLCYSIGDVEKYLKSRMVKITEKNIFF